MFFQHREHGEQSFFYYEWGIRNWNLIIPPEGLNVVNSDFSESSALCVEQKLSLLFCFIFYEFSFRFLSWILKWLLQPIGETGGRWGCLIAGKSIWATSWHVWVARFRSPWIAECSWIMPMKSQRNCQSIRWLVCLGQDQPQRLSGSTLRKNLHQRTVTENDHGAVCPGSSLFCGAAGKQHCLSTKQAVLWNKTGK